MTADEQQGSRQEKDKNRSKDKKSSPESREQFVRVAGLDKALLLKSGWKRPTSRPPNLQARPLSGDSRTEGSASSSKSGSSRAEAEKSDRKSEARKSDAPQEAGADRKPQAGSRQERQQSLALPSPAPPRADRAKHESAKSNPARGTSDGWVASSKSDDGKSKTPPKTGIEFIGHN